MTSKQNLHDSERAFHDDWAQSETCDSINVEAAFEAITAPENKWICKILGDVKGKTLLDVGTGLGESAIYFSRLGAQVSAVDISPKMVELCLKNAQRCGVTLSAKVSTAEDLGMAENTFDIVYAANLLHHVQDREQFLRNVYKILKPGGTFVAWDPLKYNPAINVYRRKATEVRTPDERPLGIGDLRQVKAFFPDHQYKTFWLASLLIFLKYYYVDGKDPNRERYWKVILTETESSIGWWFRCANLFDKVLLSLPGVKLLAWNVVQWGRKPLTLETQA